MGTVSALNLVGKGGSTKDKVAGSRNLVGGFLEGTGFEVAMEVNTEFVLDKEGTEAGAGKVFSPSLLGFAEVNVIFLDIGS
jgi:hypothetical protein